MKFNLGDFLGGIKRNWKKTDGSRVLPYRELGAYSVGAIGVNFSLNILYIFVCASMIPVMYGISPIHGTAIPFVAALINCLIQPIYAKLLDNMHHPKWGKFKPFLIVLTPLMAIFLILACWAPQDVTYKFRLIFAYATCVPVTIISGWWAGVFNTYPTAMTPNSNERTSLLSIVGIVGSLAPTILAVIVGPIRSFYDKQGKGYLAYRLLSISFAIIGAVMTFIIVFYTKERLYVHKDAKEKVRFAYGIKQCLKNKPFIIITITNGIFGIFRVLIGGSMVYVAAYKYAVSYGAGISGLTGLELQGLLSPIVGFGATPAMILMPLIAKKVGKRNALIGSQLLSTIIMIIIFMIGVKNIPMGVPSIIAFTVLGFLFAANSGVGIVANPAIGSELNDHQQYITGERLEGFMGAVGTWIGIIGLGLGMVPSIIQSKIGFMPGSDTFLSGDAYLPENMAKIDSWLMVSLGISIVSSILYMLGLFFFKYSEKMHKMEMEDVKSKAIGSSFEDESIIDNEFHHTESTTINNKEIDDDSDNKIV